MYQYAVPPFQPLDFPIPVPPCTLRPDLTFPHQVKEQIFKNSEQHKMDTVKCMANSFIVQGKPGRGGGKEIHFCV